MSKTKPQPAGHLKGTAASKAVAARKKASGAATAAAAQVSGSGATLNAYRRGMEQRLERYREAAQQLQNPSRPLSATYSAVSLDKAVEIAKRAGVLTRSGKLAARYK